MSSLQLAQLVALFHVLGHADAELVTGVAFFNLVMPCEQQRLGSPYVVLGLAIQISEEVHALRDHKATRLIASLKALRPQIAEVVLRDGTLLGHT